MDKDLCLSYETKTKNMKDEVIKWFKQVVKDRWVDCEPFSREATFTMKQYKQAQNSASNDARKQQGATPASQQGDARSRGKYFSVRLNINIGLDKGFDTSSKSTA